MAEDEEHPNHVRATTSGSTIRLEVPVSQRGKPRHHTIEVREIIPVEGFLDFLREHAVVGLAIGFAIGSQAQNVVTNLVNSFIKPIFELFFGQSLATQSITLHFHTHSANFVWGAFVYALLNFLFILGTIFFLVKWLKLDKLNKPLIEEKK
ncbi:MAG TPA: MscL family protein [Candidatus Saccharimonadales bacterium]|jgi:large-conductance mechanosensitive channel|nr:MscL family protein [Candidatus Saccharimonadales bacterium]